MVLKKGCGCKSQGELRFLLISSHKTNFKKPFDTTSGGLAQLVASLPGDPKACIRVSSVGQNFPFFFSVIKVNRRLGYQIVRRPFNTLVFSRPRTDWSAVGTHLKGEKGTL